MMEAENENRINAYIAGSVAFYPQNIISYARQFTIYNFEWQQQ